MHGGNFMKGNGDCQLQPDKNDVRMHVLLTRTKGMLTHSCLVNHS